MDAPVFEPLGPSEKAVIFKPNVSVWVTSSEKPKGSEAWKVRICLSIHGVLLILALQIQEMLRHVDIALYLAPSSNSTLEVEMTEFILNSCEGSLNEVSGISREDFRRVSSSSVTFHTRILNVQSTLSLRLK